MGKISAVLKTLFTKNTSAASATARIPLLNASGEPIGCDTMINMAKMLDSGRIETLLTSSDNLNNIKVAGVYYTVNAANPQNTPQVGNCFNNIIWCLEQGTTERVVQVLYSMSIKTFFYRSWRAADPWDDWKIINTDIPDFYKSYATLNALSTALGGGSFYGECTTDAATKAKVVTISNFLLLPNSTVTIHFKKAVPAGATLNVSSSGAKPIYYRGAAISDGDILADTEAVLQYNGTRWNVVTKEEGRRGKYGQDFVDMGLPSGTLWAKRNIDITQPDGFAASEFQYECSFASWGNTFMHNPKSTSAFDYNWGGVNESEPYYQNQVYGSTPGNSIQTDLGRGSDVARAVLGAPWRMPSKEDFKELHDNSELVDANGSVISGTDKRATVNGIVGLRYRSKNNGNIVFFPASGYGTGSSWNYRGSRGSYWSRSFDSARNGYNLYFGSDGVYPQNANKRYYGFPVRPVQ